MFRKIKEKSVIDNARIDGTVLNIEMIDGTLLPDVMMDGHLVIQTEN